jgi:outer membrane protein insertion porin family
MSLSRWVVVAAALVAATGTVRAQPPPGTIPGTPEDRATAPGEKPTVEPGAIERSTLEAPSAQWAVWSIEGDLVDDLDTVAGFLEPVMEEHKSWGPTDQLEVAEFLLKIGYHVTYKNRPAETGGLETVLVLTPVTLVRFVDVDVNAPSKLARILDPIFADDLRRRMTLRPGSALERSQFERARQLANEANRLAQYLRNEGFYDVVVTAWSTPAGPHAHGVRVLVDLGVAYEVGRITVSGNFSIPTREITEVFRHPYACFVTACGGTKRFTRKRLNEDVEEVVGLYRKRGFPGVRVTTDFDIRHSFKRDIKKVEFHIEVRERRKIDVVFEGSHYSDERLRGNLTLNAEGSYDDVEVEASAESLRRFYQTQGYFEASVTWKRDPRGVYDLITFSIFEGPRLEVGEIDITGNQAYSDGRLRDEIVTKPFRKVIIGAGGGFATSVQLEQDRDRLERFYHEHGYRDATVELRVARDHELLENAAALAAAVIAQLDAETLHIHFEVVEGKLNTVADVRFEFQGPTRVDQGELARALRQAPGKPFINEDMALDTEAIRQVYYSHGYTRTDVDSKVESTEKSPNALVVTHTITPNARKRVGRIAIRGNFKTANWVILDEMRLQEGELLTIEAAELAQSSLRSSGLFSAVQVDYFGLDEPRQEIVNVLVHVEERYDNQGEILFGGGYSSESELFLQTGVVNANLGGIGLRAETSVVFGQKEQSVEARLAFPSWVMRRLFATRFLLEISGFAKRDTKNERFGALLTLGTSVAATKTYTRGALAGLLLQMRYDFRYRSRDIDLVRPAGNSDDLAKDKVRTISSTVGPLVAYDRRRDRDGRINPLLPERGYRLEVSAAYGEDVVLGTARFAKLGGKAQHFIPLGSKFRLSNAFRYDHGIPLGGDVALPEVERFFAGGDTTVRGYEQDRLATEIIEEDLAPFGDLTRYELVPAGGNIRFIHNLDLQAIVWDNSLVSVPIASAIFLDTGIVTNSLVGFKVRQLRHSVGIALARVIAPFGAFSIEYAIPLDPELGDDPRGRAHINFGFLF